MLHGQGPLEETARRRFLREAQLAARLGHPGICPVLDFGWHEGSPYLAMPWIEGETLESALQRRRNGDEEALGWLGSSKPRNIRRAVELLRELSRAVAAAHETGVVHRDLKPGNVILDPAGHPIVLDFGLARSLEVGGQELTLSGDRLGTPAYMAPEQLRSTRRVDQRCDVWALGTILYEALTLERAFPGATVHELERQTQRGFSPAHVRGHPHLRGDLRAILETAMSPDPDHRYHDAGAFASDLEAFFEGRSIAARRPGTLRRCARWVRREPLLATVVALLIVLVGVGGFLTARWSDIERGVAAGRARQLESELVEASTFRLMEPEAAASIYESLTKEHPEDPTARAEYWTLLYEGEKRDRLRAALAAPAAAGPETALLRERLLTWLEEGADPLAGDLTDLEARARPTELAAFAFMALQRSIVDLDRERAKEALLLHEMALKTAETKSPHLLGMHVACLQNAGEWDRAAVLGRHIARRWPMEGPMAYYAALGLQRSDPERALKLLSGFPGRRRNGVPLLLEAKLLRRIGRGSDAEALLEELVERSSRPLLTATAASQICHAALQKGDVARASEYAEKGLAAMPTDLNLHMTAGYVASRRREWAEAVRHFERARILESDGHLTIWHYAAALRLEGKPEQSLEAVDRGLELLDDVQPDSDASHRKHVACSLRQERAQALLMLERYEECLDAAEEATRFGPRKKTAVGIAWVRADALRQLGRKEEALGHYEQAVRLTGDEPPKLLVLAHAELRAELGLPKDPLPGLLAEIADAPRPGDEAGKAIELLIAADRVVEAEDLLERVWGGAHALGAEAGEPSVSTSPVPTHAFLRAALQLAGRTRDWGMVFALNRRLAEHGDLANLPNILRLAALTDRSAWGRDVYGDLAEERPPSTSARVWAQVHFQAVRLGLDSGELDFARMARKACAGAGVPQAALDDLDARIDARAQQLEEAGGWTLASLDGVPRRLESFKRAAQAADPEVAIALGRSLLEETPEGLGVRTVLARRLFATSSEPSAAARKEALALLAAEVRLIDALQDRRRISKQEAALRLQAIQADRQFFPMMNSRAPDHEDWRTLRARIDALFDA